MPDDKKIPNEQPTPEAPPPNMAAPKMRQIVIETDGQNIRLVSAEATHLELKAIFASLLEMMNRKQ